MHNKKEILILGGTGKTGRRIAERLTKRGLPVRIGSRSGQPFEWEDRATWLPVLKDVETAYVAYYPDLAFPGAAATVQAFIETAVKSGVKRLVLLSGRAEDGALLGEKAARDSGVEWTIVRASWFCQNFSENFLLEPVMSGEVAFPGGRAGGGAVIDVEDVADVAAAALAEDGHLGQVYEVTGPRLLTFADAVQEIARVTGREIRYVPVSTDEYAKAMLKQGVPAEFANPLTELIAAVLDGRNASLNDGVRRALGREPRDFGDFARDAAASGVWG
jgi:uncharacterized protein YbjT (DUF2867 family)